MNNASQQLLHQLNTHKLRVAFVILAAIISSAVIPASLALATVILTAASSRDALINFSLIYMSIRLVAIIRGTSRYYERIASHGLALGVLPSWREKIYNTFIELIPGAIPEKSQGEILERAVSDVDAILDYYVRALLPYLGVASTVACLAVLAIIFQPEQLTVVFALSIVGSFALYLTKRLTPTDPNEALSKTSGSLKTSVLELMAIKDELRHSPGDNWLVRKVYTQSEALSAFMNSGERATMTSTTIFKLLPLVFGSIALFMASVIHHGQHSNTYLILPLAMLGSSDAFGQLGPSRTALFTSLAATERILSITKIKTPRSQPENSLEIDTTPATIKADRIDFQHKNGQVVFKSLSLQVAPRQHIAIVGPSGVGKTTLLHLLTGHLLPTAGQIQINGITTSMLDPELIAKKIHYLPQRAHFFASTLRYNIALGREDICDEQIISSLNSLGLSSWFRKLPAGLDTMAGPTHGLVPSGGELQRIALVRALVREPSGIVLDEPGSSLDSANHSALLETIRVSFADIPVVIATHSEKEMRNMDEIWMIADYKAQRVT